MELWEELEHRVRTRAVRVADRLHILEEVRSAGSAKTALDAERARRLDRIREAARRLREAADR